MRACPQIWCLAVCLACVDGTTGLSLIEPPAPQPMPVPVPMPGVEGSVFDPEVQVEAPAPTPIYTPAAIELGRLQGGDHALAWNGQRYIIAWLQNIRGHIFVVSVALDPSRLVAPEGYQTLSPDYEEIEDAPRSRPLLLPGAGGRTLLLWSSERALKRVWLDASGEALGPPQVVIDQPLFSKVLVYQERYLVLAVPLGAASRTRLQAMWLDSEGRQVSQLVTVLNSRALADAVYTEEGLTLLWGDREAGGQDFVHLSHRTPDLETEVSTAQIYEAEHTAGIFLGPTSQAAVAAVWDFNEGSALLDLRTGEPLMRLNMGRYDGMRVQHDLTGARLALVHEAGEYRATNPLSNRLEHQAIDYSAARAGPRTVIDDGGPRGECLEEVQTTIRALPTGAVRLGVSWVMGCSVRTLYFSELSGR